MLVLLHLGSLSKLSVQKYLLIFVSQSYFIKRAVRQNLSKKKCELANQRSKPLNLFDSPFQVCCVFTLSCGGTSSANNTYAIISSFNINSDTDPCIYTFWKCSMSVIGFSVQYNSSCK